MSTTLFNVLVAVPTSAQDSFDATWYDGTKSHVKIAVVEDGVYKVSGTDLADSGVDIASLSITDLQLFENGSEIPIAFVGDAAIFDPADYFYFVGRRNTGADEKWAYNYDASAQTSDYYSLYSDTTQYWLRLNGAPGIRYAGIIPPATGGATILSTADSRRIENDLIYYPGQGSSAGDPIYTTGEGFYDNRIQHNTSQNVIVRAFQFDLANRTSAATDSIVVTALVASETVSQHLIQLKVWVDVNGTPTLSVFDTENWSGIANRTLHATIPQSDLPAGDILRVEIDSDNRFGSGTPNNLLFDWVQVQFVRQNTPVDGQFRLIGRSGGPYTYSVTSASPTLRVLNTSTAESFTLDTQAGTASFSLTPQSSSPTLWVTDELGFGTPAKIELNSGSNLTDASNSADYVIIAAPSLMQSAANMAAHRTTASGGSHETMVVNVQDVFNEFDYGRPTPLAIRRFVRFASSQWSTPLHFMTLWGDALYPQRTRPIPVWEVPAFGHTVSDSWFAMQNAGLDDYSESIAIGRIPIRTNERGNIFVEKMQTYESEPISTWQKRALFLVGGFTPSERTRLQQSALQWSAMVASDPMGMDTLHFFKTSTSILDPTFRDSLQAALEVGASWEVYFGHSATQTWEIVTDPPSQYNNSRKLPIVLSLGCFTGDYATGTGADTDILSFSEQLVVESLSGSIAHWGASSSGTIGASSRISNEVHQTVFADTVRVLGEAMRIAKKRYDSLYSDPISVKHLLQYGLIGDPATRIALPAKPDFRIADSDIRITPRAPVPADRELTVDVAVRNVGLTTPDSLTIELIHTLPNSTASTIRRTIPPFGSSTNEQFRLDISDVSVGLNRIQVGADVDNRYDEIDELNNDAEQPITVFASGLSVLSPINFALFPSSDVTLRATSSSAEINPPATVFQIDTEPTFDSPSLLEATVQTANLVAEWKPQALVDGTYFWRVRVDLPEQADVWTSGAFTIDSPLGETGWAQSGRLFDGNSTSPTLLPHDDSWQINTFDIVVSVSSERGGGTEVGQFSVGSEIYERLGLGFGVLVQSGRDGSVIGSSSGPTYVNDFVDPAVSRNRLTSTLALASEGDYVFVRTRHLGNKNLETVIPDSVKAIFAGLGSSIIESLTYQDLWILKTRIGFPDETEEVINVPSSGVNEIIRLFDPVFQYRDGSVVSPVIGPTTRWISAAWRDSLTAAGESVKIDVLSASMDSVLISGVEGGGPVDLSTIDIRKFPFLRLRATLVDEAHLSTPQLQMWRVAFNLVPEIAIDRASIVLSADTVRAGDLVTLSATVANLSDLVADSVVVSIQLIDADNVTSTLRRDTLTAFSGRSVFEISVDTEDLVGDNTFRIEAAQPGVVDQIQVNNVALVYLTVLGDTTPPEFTITVDGQSLPNDPDPVTNLQDPSLPFVSNKPIIEIQIEDDNPFARLDADTMTVSVTFNDRTLPRSALTIQSEDDANAMVVSFQPDLTGIDSTHTVVVEVQDAVGNASPNSPYQVHFRTQSAMQLDTFYPYPNPMNSFTTFAFNLRGADALNVENMRLRIYSVAGRLVREFNMTEDPSLLDGGSLRIGWNKLRWDGRDSDGDLVATGVYLYRVFARVDGEDLKSANASEVEKVVVIR